MKKHILSFILAIIIAHSSIAQESLYKNKVRPIVKAKIDSMYPQAVVTDLYRSDSLQLMAISCHCSKTTGEIILEFDTNGHLRYKEVHYYSIQGLPDTVTHYVKHPPSTMKFDTGYMVKYYNSKGEITYGLVAWEYHPSNESAYYLFKFKSTGELISKKMMPIGKR